MKFSVCSLEVSASIKTTYFQKICVYAQFEAAKPIFCRIMGKFVRESGYLAWR